MREKERGDGKSRRAEGKRGRETYKVKEERRRKTENGKRDR